MKLTLEGFVIISKEGKLYSNKIYETQRNALIDLVYDGSNISGHIDRYEDLLKKNIEIKPATFVVEVRE